MFQRRIRCARCAWTQSKQSEKCGGNVRAASNLKWNSSEIRAAKCVIITKRKFVCLFMFALGFNLVSKVGCGSVSETRKIGKNVCLLFVRSLTMLLAVNMVTFDRMHCTLSTFFFAWRFCDAFFFRTFMMTCRYVALGRVLMLYEFATNQKLTGRKWPFDFVYL